MNTGVIIFLTFIVTIILLRLMLWYKQLLIIPKETIENSNIKVQKMGLEESLYRLKR